MCRASANLKIKASVRTIAPFRRTEYYNATHHKGINQEIDCKLLYYNVQQAQAAQPAQPAHVYVDGCVCDRAQYNRIDCSMNANMRIRRSEEICLRVYGAFAGCRLSTPLKFVFLLIVRAI